VSSPTAPLVTLVKFIRNWQENQLNHLLTRTMGRVGFIAAEYYRANEKDPQTYDLPTHDEYWLVQILEEIGRNQPRGCYLLRPLQRVATSVRGGLLEPDVVRLIPGTFRVEKDGRTLYIYPPRTGSVMPNYILDVETKNYVLSHHRVGERRYTISSFIVVLDPGLATTATPLPRSSDQPPPSDQPLLDLDQLGDLVSNRS
jgi:hypothetical protein